MLDLEVLPPQIDGLPDRVRMRPRIGIARRLRIGLLNLMPDAAIVQAEQQFRTLVGPHARLHPFAVREIRRGPAAEAYLDRHYQPHHALADARLDGLIVTGSEPRAARLEDEPFFRPLGAVVDWAAADGVSTLFSCLAAHAAVLHRDGIRRRPLPAKLSGVFTCRATAAHPLLAGMPDGVGVPHSRWNNLAERELVSHGYVVLRRSAEVGVDLFIRDDSTLSVFLQGHPEYEQSTLAREYRRDMGRFLDGTSARMPDVPAEYFAPDAAARLDAFAQVAAGRVGVTEFPALDSLRLRPPAWQAPASRLFGNWLACVARRQGLDVARGVA